MGKLIKMIWTSKDNCLFIYGMNKKGELTFRTSRNINHLQKEKTVIDKEMCYTNLYYFPINYLQGLPTLE